MAGRRLFGRILKGYIALALAFAVILGVCIYTGGYLVIKRDFEASASAELEKNARMIDARLAELRAVMQYLSGESALYDYAVNDYNDYLGAAVQEMLRHNTGDFEHDTVSVYVSKLNSSLDRVIGTTQISGVFEFLTQHQFSSGSGATIRDYFKNSKGAGGVLVKFCAQSSPGSRGIIIIEENYIGGVPVYIMGYLNMNTLTEELSLAGSSLALLDGQSMICNLGANAFKTSNTINSYLKDNLLVMLGSSFVDGSIYVNARSNVYNWNYVLARSADSMNSSAVMMLFYVLAVCSVIFVINVGLIWLITRWVYKPVNETVKFVARYNNDDFFDEGVFVRRSVSKLNKEREELLVQMGEAELELKTKFVSDLLHGLVREEDFAKHTERFELDEVHGPYRAVLIRFSDYELLEESFSKENIEKIKLEIEEFIDDQLKSQIIYHSVMLDRRTIALISFGREGRQLREILVDMAMMVQGSFDVEITGSIGSDCDNLVEISKSYKSACDIMENRFSAGSRNAIVTEEDVRDINSESFYYPLDVERELITGVVRARAEETHKLIGGILEENFEKRRLSKDRVDAFVFAITATINRVVEMLGKTADEIFGDGKIVFLDLKMCADAGELAKKIYELFDTIMEFIDAVDKAQQDNLSDLLLEYIHSHYNEDISLLDIGGHFNLSQCYTSTIFKEATGENFKDYLSRYRIKMAKEILAADPTIKNNELAKMIGCNTVATLFRLFNKYEGMSPGQYVKNLKS